MKHCFLINPAAGKAGAKTEEKKAIAAVMEKLGLPWEIYVSRGAGDCADFVRRYSRAQDGEIRFYACGGDGTLNEAVNGAAGLEGVSVASIPWGTGNDFIKNFPDQRSFRDIARQVLAPSVKVDLLRVNRRFCVNICNAGFDAQVALHMAKFKRIPFIRGSAAYGLSVLYCFLKKTSYTFSVELAEGEGLEDAFLLAVMANGRFYGGAYEGAPRARVDDGLLDVVLIKRLPRRRIAPLIKIYKEGRHLEHPAFADVLLYRQTRGLILKSRQALPVSIDGELISTAEVRVETAPQMLRFVCPSGEPQRAL